MGPLTGMSGAARSLHLIAQGAGASCSLDSSSRRTSAAQLRPHCRAPRRCCCSSDSRSHACWAPACCAASVAVMSICV